MAHRISRIVVCASVALALGMASVGCDQIKGAGEGTKDKVKQGGDAGGSTGYP